MKQSPFGYRREPNFWTPEFSGVLNTQSGNTFLRAQGLGLLGRVDVLMIHRGSVRRATLRSGAGSWPSCKQDTEGAVDGQ